MNNYVVVSPGQHPETWVAFKWGEVREIVYKLGETLLWGDDGRPQEASGAVAIGGWVPLDDNGDNYAYYRVTIVNDVISEVHEIDATEFDELEKMSEARS
jgi:hypothetical protein